MDISVLIATRLRPASLARTLESLCRLDTEGLHWELLLVDNGGDEETQAVVADYAARLPLRRWEEREPGKSRALNRLLPEVRGALVVFTDDDVEVDVGWLQALHAGARRWPDHTIFGGRVHPAFPPGHALPLSPGDPYYDMAYAEADWEEGEGPYAAGRVFGPNMAIRAPVFADGWMFAPEVGPNVGDYIMGGETDLVERLERAGHGAVYLPDSLVHHHVRPEQLQRDWLLKRAFRFGRMQGYFGRGPDAGLVGVAHLRLLKKRFALRLRRVLARSAKERLLLDMEIEALKGTLHQERKTERVAAD